ncbi:MAG: hypothetical protein OEP48_08350 [Betaproteobacteria bacterium]|nr:hypothetical protein [Betaproteobacteria bacterium]MDH3436805.1 hypothetical protein [Betaproteobacteria bacterium]
MNLATGKRVYELAMSLLALVPLLLVPAPPAQAQITFRSAAQASAASGGGGGGISFVAAGAQTAGTGATITPVVPGGTSVGDFAVLIVAGRPSDTSEPTAPAGWTLRSSSLRQVGANDLNIMTFYRLFDGTAGDGNPTITLPVNWRGNAGGMSGQIAVWRGVDATTPFDVADVTGNSPATRDWTPPSITTVTNNAWVVSAVATSDDNRLRLRTPNGFTGRMLDVAYDTTVGGHHAMGLADKTQATAGAVTMLQWREQNRQPDPWASITFALRPAPLVPDLVINVPTLTAAGDVMIASIGVRPCSSTNGGACTLTVLPVQSGWTQVGTTIDQTGGGTGGFGNRLAVYWRVATAADVVGGVSYGWNFGGAPVNGGAIGGITSFSGVDTTIPIVAQGGQATPNAYTHTAPSINTGTVTNTMLVSTHADNSSATWTPPGTMTEAVDVPSLTAPNALGISMEVNWELRAAAGATGTRTATQNNNAASDTGAAHLLALRPAGGVPTPGSFNAFETSTAAGAITGVIRTKIAGSAFSLDIVAIQSGGQQSTFTDQVIVELLGNNTLGVALDAQNCPTSFTLVQTVAPDPTITAGRSMVAFAAVPDSWRDLRVRVRWPAASPTVTGCSTDNFAIRPNTFANFGASDIDWQTAGTTRVLNDITFSAVTHKAGRPFSIRAAAVNAAGTPAITTNYTGTPTATLTTCAGAACTASVGTLALGTTFVAGQLVSDVASYNEVGSFGLQLVDDTFASVDLADSTPAERNIVSVVVNAGRFVPDHFAVALNTPTFATACSAGGFTYLGQAFNYTVQPVITVTAQDFGNNTTALYASTWWRISNTSLTGKSYTAASGTLNTSGLPSPDPAIAPTGAGTGTLTFDSGTGLFFTRTAPVAPFDADVSLAINVIDDDGVAYGANPAQFGAATAGNGIAFNNGKPMRFGRLRIGNANGSQLTPLPVLVEVQYYSGPPGNAFVTNTDDSCTALAASNVAMSNFTPNLAPSPNCKTAITGVSAFSAGRSTLTLAAPGSGNEGTVDLTVNLGSTGSGTTCTSVGGGPTPVSGSNIWFLKGNWTGGAFDKDPSARATFGVFQGAEEVIFTRENF